MAILPGTRLGPYEVLSALGAGGMGEVYRARDTRLDRDVALKVLPANHFSDESARARLLREARAAAGLNHPNICTIHEVSEADGQAYIAMEFVEGQCLSDCLRGQKLPADSMLRYGSQIADALAHAHERHIVHRDLKCANVVITPEGRAKVLDFGLAKRVTGEELSEATTQSQASLTQPGTMVGTLAYMAPEQLRGEPADARSDIWALGVVLFEMAAGSKPFQGRTGFELSSAILNQAPAPLSEQVPLELRVVVEHCLAKEPGQRYQRAGEVRAALEAIQAGTTVPWTALRYHFVQLRWPAALTIGIVLLTVLAGMNIGGFRDRLFPKTAAGAIRSLAVLPLENLSHQPEQDYFADGMTDELITDLSKIEALRVISRTSMVHYKGTKKTLPDIARELNVDAIVEGSTLRSGDRVRVTAQLIQAATDKHLWADSYERDMSDILGLQREVARTIAQQIRVTLQPTERARLTGAQPGDPRAYEAYLKGRYFSNKWTEEGVRKGISYFQEAIGIDPTNALAYAGLADSYNALGDFGVGVMSPREASCKAEAAALKATELDGMLGEAHAALAMGQFRCDQDWMSADKEFVRALELNPSYAAAHHWYAHYLLAAGRIQEALAESKRAYDLSPIDPELGVHLQWHYYYTHDYDSAIQQGLKTMELDPTFNEPHLYLGMAYEQKGIYGDAIRELEKAVELSARRVIAVSALGHAYALAGQTAQASKVLKELEDLSKHRYISSYDIAILDVGLGYRDQALTRLEEAYREGSYWVFTLQRDPRLDSLHSNPRFQDLVRRVGLP